jgi:hypothetical protein
MLTSSKNKKLAMEMKYNSITGFNIARLLSITHAARIRIPKNLTAVPLIIVYSALTGFLGNIQTPNKYNGYDKTKAKPCTP